MIDLGKYIYLIVCELAQFRCMLKFVNTHNLYSKNLFSFSMLCSINISVLSFSYTLQKNIILNNLIHLKNIILMLVFYLF